MSSLWDDIRSILATLAEDLEFAPSMIAEVFVFDVLSSEDAEENF